MDQIDKQKINLSKIINYKKTTIPIKEEKTKNEIN